MDEFGERGLQAHEGVEVGGRDEGEEVDGSFDLFWSLVGL